MSPDARLSEVDTANPTYLLVSSNRGMSSVVPLTVGASVFVGSGTNCKIQVLDESVQQLHCMFLLEEGNVLKVQDWNTNATFLNDAAVVDEVRVQSGDVVSVGSCRLTAVLDVVFHQTIAVDLLNEDDLTDVQRTPDEEIADEQAPIEEMADVAQSENESKMEDEFVFSVGDDPEANDAQESGAGFKYDFDADLKQGTADDLSAFDSLPSDLGFAFNNGSSADGSTGGIEVEQLRFEIADRDTQIMTLKQKLAECDNGGSVDESETLKLVSRMEDLLDELQVSDERVQTLEELLRVAEQATVAEREERAQMEKWVTEIEKRVGQREAESQAEIEGLARQLQIEKQDADVVQAQLESIATATESAQKQSEAVAMLNKQIEDLRANLQEVNEKNRELLERPVLSDDEIDIHAQLLETQDELAQVRLQASKERADMARRHAELESMRDQLEMRLEQSPKNTKEGDTRVQAMREHLKEIHAQEQAEKAEQKSTSLGGRIADLLTRLR